MAPFTTEEALRLKFQLDNLPEVTSALIETSINHAHSIVTTWVRETCLAEVPEPIVVAETLLAGAALLRSLSARMALDRREVRLAGHQLETGKRFPALIAVAQAAEKEALQLVTPWLRHGAAAESPALLTTGSE
ncbi:MAG: hypothetical protein KAH38_08885 [Candidatus Hydrogenedentes bacterium]|nr:hypothetical protein [Candidatus Hydrogenedentota bacterium]